MYSSEVFLVHDILIEIMHILAGFEIKIGFLLKWLSHNYTEQSFLHYLTYRCKENRPIHSFHNKSQENRLTPGKNMEFHIKFAFVKLHSKFGYERVFSTINS